MTDTVLQSFCERCGTRYTFTEPQESKPDGGRAKLGLFARRGPETTAENSVSTALPSSERFKGTFHFCLECRQYTCVNCWNADAGACLGCRAPGETVRPERNIGVFGAPRIDRAAVSTGRPGDTSVSGRATKSTEQERGQEPNVSGGTTAPSGELPWVRTASDVPPGEFDEWGRPRDSEPADQQLVEPTSTTAPTPAVDPWRGVQFSGDEEATVSGETSATEVPGAVGGAGAAASSDAAPRAWRSRVSSERQDSAVEGPYTAPGDGDDDGDAQRLQAMTAGADGSSWARAVAAAEASRVAKAAAAQAPSPSDPEVVRSDLAEPAREEVASTQAMPVQDANSSPVVVTPVETATAADTTPPATDPAATSPARPGSATLDAEVELERTERTEPNVEPVAAPARTAPEREPEVERPTTFETAPAADGADDSQRPGSTAEPVPAPTPSEPSEPTGHMIAFVEPEALPPAAEPPPAEPAPAPPATPAPNQADLVPPPAIAPIPAPSIEVWSTPVQPGPFAQPYAPPTPTSQPRFSVVPPSGPPFPPAPMPEPAVTQAPVTASLPPTPSAGFIPPPPSPMRPTPAPWTGTRACANCALPLSAKARFCRRCGAPQT